MKNGGRVIQSKNSPKQQLGKDYDMPQDLEAERSVLGSILLNSASLTTVVDKLKPNHFIMNEHKNIYEAILQLFSNNDKIDLVTVSSRLKKMELLNKTGGRLYLADVLDSVPTSANIEPYADIVINHAVKRRFIDASQKIQSHAFDPSTSAEEVTQTSQEIISNIAKENDRNDFFSISAITPLVSSLIFEAMDNSGHDRVKTPFSSLNERIIGFKKQNLIILAARPSIGKTTLSLNFSHFAAKNHYPVAFFSMEMSKEEIAVKLLSMEQSIDSTKIEFGDLNEKSYAQVQEGLAKLAALPLVIDDTSSLTPFEIKTKLKRMKVNTEIKLCVIDYIQLMKSGKKKDENRNQEVSDIVRELKAISKELDIPIIGLSQLSRDIEKRSDPRPKLSDLRDSGDIEQAADMVMFIYSNQDTEEFDGKPKPDFCNVKISIAKNRGGKVGEVELGFRKNVSKFYESASDVVIRNKAVTSN